MRTALGLLALLAVGCSSSSGSDGSLGGQGATGGTSVSGGGGTSTAAGATASGGTTAMLGGGAGGSSGSGGSATPVMGLPTPTTPGGVAKPAGTAGNLKVLPWAGFKAAVTYTFDDAQPSQIEHWAELKAENIRGTFYLNTQLATSEAGFDTTWQDAEAQGWELGNHTVHHCASNGTCSNGATFTTIPQEFDDVTTYIKTTGHQADAWTAAYPFGDTGYEAAAKERFFLARGVGGGMVGAGDNTDPFNLPCFAAIAAGGEPASTFSADVDSAHTQGKWLIFLFHSVMPTTQMWYAPTDIASITGSIDHAKTLGDVWIDSLVNVGAYWLGQKLVASAVPTTSAGSTTWTWTLPAHFPPGKSLRVSVDGGTLSQGSSPLAWDDHGYYAISLDAGTLTLAP